MKARTAVLFLLVTMLASLDGIAPALWAAEPGSRVCRKECTRRAKACLRNARKERAVRATACKGAAQRSCRAGVRATLRKARNLCGALRSRCRACCTAGGAGCAGETPLFSGVFRVPDRRVFDTLPLPPGPNGTGLTWLPTADGALVIDPSRRSPVSAAAECAAFVVACFRPGVRNWAGCFEQAPPCPTDTPFLDDGPACCPALCAVRYQELRQAGRDGPAAVTGAIWDAPSCIPGLVGREAGQ